MRLARKLHVQQTIQFNRRGGARKGAGRKRTGPRKRVAHTRRPEHKDYHPVHVTLRVLPAVGRLRRRQGFDAVRKAMQVVLARPGFRIVHMSIQGNHLHLICEASTKSALSRGVQAFKISAARQLNKRLRRKGKVFADRYHAEAITTPTQMRACLCYVLNNWRRHGEDRDATGRVDIFSTGIYFTGWKETDIPKVLVIPEGSDVLPYTAPQTWMLKDGWKRGGPAISLYDCPGPRA